MLWFGLRSRQFECFSDGEGIKHLDDKLLCLGPDGVVLASFPLEEVLIYTKSSDIAEAVLHAWGSERLSSPEPTG